MLWSDFAEYNLVENMRVKIAMAASDAGDAHALQQNADFFLIAVGDGTVQTLPDGETSSGSLANSCARDSPAQLYVALSRSGYPSDPIQGRGVRVFVTDVEGSQGRIPGQTGVYTRNVVYKEVLA